ncbi:MAG: hypothetical protein H0V55_08825, partial [Thermoleophilaceae bacterium]|nr:hypothetical protein [Thermoleophilaceae bacterium]
MRRVGEARTHLAAAREDYTPLAGTVDEEDPRLDREIDRAFALIDSRLAQSSSPESVREATTALSSQLMDGALEELVRRR